MGICTKGTKSTIKRSMSPKIICNNILIIKPAALNKIIRPIAIIIAKIIPKKIVSMIIFLSQTSIVNELIIIYYIINNPNKIKDKKLLSSNLILFTYSLIACSLQSIIFNHSSHLTLIGFFIFESNSFLAVKTEDRFTSKYFYTAFMKF